MFHPESNEHLNKNHEYVSFVRILIVIYLSMNETTFMNNTESIIKHNKMIPDWSQPNKSLVLFVGLRYMD